MSRDLVRYTSRFCLPLFGALLSLLFFLIDGTAPAGRSLAKIEGVDPVAYYAMAHSLLFDRDFDLSNEYRHQSPGEEGREVFATRPNTGLPGNPWPIGFPILQVPFLLAGYISDVIQHRPADGYSRTCVVAYYLGIIFWLCIGMLSLYELLRRIGRYTGVSGARVDWTALVVVFALWPSTTLAYYTFAGMSHIADFMACSVFLLAWWSAKDSDSLRSWLLCGLASGLMALVRWQSLLFITVPVTYDFLHVRGRPQWNLKWLWPRLLAGIVMMIVLLPQFLEWHAIYGRYLVIPQGSDFLQFPPRYTLNVLFSSRHGWFVWTPVVALGIAGLIYCVTTWPRLAISILFAIALQILFCASMPTNWHGGASFSIRMLTNCVPAVSVGIMLLALNGSRKALIGLSGFGLFCIIYTLLFAAQYRLDLIPKDDQLTVRELLIDKVDLPAAIARQREYLAVQRTSETRQLGQTADPGTAAARRYPTDRQSNPRMPNTLTETILAHRVW